MVVTHLCRPYGRRPSPTKIDAIQAMKEICESQSEVRRFLGACAFYHIWIPHYAHIVDPLYHLLRRGKKFKWKPEHTKAMKKLKKTLRRSEALKKPSCDRLVIVIVDTSPTGIRWVINQADSDGLRYPIRFGENVFNERQRGYAQVKRELWGVVLAIKADQD